MAPLTDLVPPTDDEMPGEVDVSRIDPADLPPIFPPESYGADQKTAARRQRAASQPDRSHERVADERSNVAGFEDVSATSVADARDAVMARFDHFQRYPDAGFERTGISPELDRELMLSPGTMTILAGRAASGKSAMALQIARHMADLGPVLYLLTEMNIAQIIERSIAATAHIPVWRLRGHRRGDDPAVAQVRANVDKALAHLSDQGLDFAHVQGMKAPEISQRIRKWASAQEHTPRGVFIDNLWGVGLAAGLNGDANQSSLKFAKIAEEFATLSGPSNSGGIDAPIIVVHHTNREGLGNGRQTTANLGGSDHIGNWASNVMILAEEDDTLDEPGIKPPPGELETHGLYLTKSREGRAGLRFGLSFIGEQLRFQSAGDRPAPFSRAPRTPDDDEAREAFRNLPPI